MSDNKKKSRIFNLLLYPDNLLHMQAIANLTNFYKSVGICHDKDVYENDVLNEDGTIKHHAGEIKKKHYHFVVQFDNPRYVSGVAKEFEIEERFIEVTQSFSGSKKYLLHWGNPEKYQYDTSDLVGVLAPKLIKQLTELTEESQIQMLVDFIDNTHTLTNMRNVYNFAIKNGCFATYRRCYTMLNDFVFIHNNSYSIK